MTTITRATRALTRHIGAGLIFAFGLFHASQAIAQGFVLDFRKPIFSNCAYRSSCVVAGVDISAFRTAAGEKFIENATLRPATMYWDRFDGLGVLGGGQDDEIDPDEKIVIQLPVSRSVRVLNLSDLFLGSSGRDSPGGEWATILTSNLGGEIVRYDLQGGVLLPESEFNSWGTSPGGRIPGRGFREVDIPMVEVVLDLDAARAGLRAAGLEDDEAVITRYMTELRPIKRPDNGEQGHSLDSSIENEINRIEFLARQKPNNDYSVESIEFWRVRSFE